MHLEVLQTSSKENTQKRTYGFRAVSINMINDGTLAPFIFRETQIYWPSLRNQRDWFIINWHPYDPLMGANWSHMFLGDLHTNSNRLRITGSILLCHVCPQFSQHFPNIFPFQSPVFVAFNGLRGLKGVLAVQRWCSRGVFWLSFLGEKVTALRNVTPLGPNP